MAPPPTVQEMDEDVEEIVEEVEDMRTLNFVDEIIAKRQMGQSPNLLDDLKKQYPPQSPQPPAREEKKNIQTKPRTAMQVDLTSGSIFARDLSRDPRLIASGALTSETPQQLARRRQVEAMQREEAREMAELQAGTRAVESGYRYFQDPETLMNVREKIRTPQAKAIRRATKGGGRVLDI